MSRLSREQVIAAAKEVGWTVSEEQVVSRRGSPIGLVHRKPGDWTVTLALATEDDAHECYAFCLELIIPEEGAE